MVVVVHPSPGVQTPVELAADVLIGVGKHYDALRREQQLRRAWELTELWLQAEQTRHMVVVDAHLLARNAFQRIKALPVPNLWLVDRGSEQPTSPVAGIRQLLDELPRLEPPPTGHMPTLAVPSSNFLTFRADCRDLMRRDRFNIVDRVYVGAYNATADWLDQQPPRSVPTGPAIIRQLRALTSTAVTAEETVVRLRAAQAAYLTFGALLGLEPIRRPRANSQWELPVDLPAPSLHPDYSRRLRILVSPHLAAASVLHAIGLAPANIANLNLSDIHLDRATVEVDHGGQGRSRFDIPNHALSLLRAQTLARAQQGAGSADRVFTNNKGDPHRPHTIRNWVLHAARRAHVWRPDQQLWPLWHPVPVTGYRIRIVVLEDPWHLHP